MATTYDLISILGRTQLTELQRAVGPSQTYIPTEATPEHLIAEVVGFKAMQSLCQEFGGSSIWIGNGYANQMRNEEILRLVLAGISKDNIAACYGITARYVQIITRADTREVYGRRCRHARRLQATAAFGHRGVKRRAKVQSLQEPQ